MPQKLNSAGKMQNYVPKGNGDASGEYGDSATGSNIHYTKDKVKVNVIDKETVVSTKAKKELSKNELDALDYYVSGDGMYVNNYLRGRNGVNKNDLTDEDNELIKDLDSATNKPIDAKVLYRSVDAEAIFGKMSQLQYENLVANIVYGEDSKVVMNSINGIKERALGKTITDEGYVSTTKSYDVASDWGDFTGSDKPIVLEIEPSKNTKGVDVSFTDKNASSEQQEILLARSQKYKITDISSKDGNIYVKVKMQ